jgi:hypothetical protein
MTRLTTSTWSPFLNFLDAGHMGRHMKRLFDKDETQLQVGLMMPELQEIPSLLLRW